ncbi:hypothetical protein [Comamonas sp. 4034]|uniref:hypothetical protein n=1 Tax=Comamonas sp. 4034 TaxID=3156455 RepID=UPI00320BD198
MFVSLLFFAAAGWNLFRLSAAACLLHYQTGPADGWASVDAPFSLPYGGKLQPITRQ